MQLYPNDLLKAGRCRATWKNRYALTLQKTSSLPMKAYVHFQAHKLIPLLGFDELAIHPLSQ